MIGGSIAQGGSGLLLANMGFVVWTLCFLVLYAVLIVGCEGDLRGRQIAGVDAVTLTLSVLWLAHLPPIAWAIRRARKGEAIHAGDEFLLRLALLLGVTALVATLWIGFPILVLRPC